MKAYYDCMNFSNVVSFSYVFELANAENAIKKTQEDFLKRVFSSHMNFKGPLFYLLDDEENKKIRVQYFTQVEKLILADKDILCQQSYYSQEKTICVRCSVEELKNLKDIINIMEKKCRQDHLKMYGPLYYVLGSNYEKPYYMIKSGVRIDKGCFN